MLPAPRIDSPPELSTDAPPNVDARLRQILDQYGPWLRRTVDRLCPTGMGIDPREVEQQTLIRLWRALEREKDLSRPASYLYRIVSSVTVDAIRAVRRRSESSLELRIAEQEESETVELPSMEPASDHRLIASDTEAAISRALGRLSANRRRAVMLHLDGFNNREVATLLAWTEAKVRNLVWRGLRDLRAELRKEGYEP